MTSAIYRNAPVLSVPLSQNTASVFEHNCLYTHDIRKKQKRWQDGLLRYHTFNQRVLVFDPAGNKVGDTHWTGNVALQEGDEVTLEKWGILVDVSERVRQTATDLAEIRGPSKNMTPSRPLSMPVRSPTSGVTYQSVSQPKHKSLNTLLSKSRNTPCRAHPPARSTSTASSGGLENHAKADGPPAKRIRLDTPSVQRNQRASEIQTLDSSKVVTRRTEPRDRLSTSTPRKVPDIIDLCDDPMEDFQGFSSDIFLPSPVRLPPGEQISMRRTSTTMQLPRVPNSRVVQGKPGAKESEPQRRSPPVRSDLAFKYPAVNDVQKQVPIDRDKGSHAEQHQASSINPAAKKFQTMALKLAPTVTRRKKGLLCQSQLLPKPSPNNDGASHRPSAAPVRQSLRGWTISPEPQMEPEPEPAMVGDCVILDDPMDLQSDIGGGNSRVTRDFVDDASRLQQRETSPEVSPRVSPVEIKKAAAASIRKKSPAERRPATVAARSKKAAAPEPHVDDLLLEAPLIDPPNVSKPTSNKAPVLPHKAAKKTSRPAVTAVPPEQRDLGPWSREAFDLFVWRPPGWNEQEWCIPKES